MRKTDKKIENQIRRALTEVCESALKEFSGFEWLSHRVSYSHFPQSLQIVCVFDNHVSLAEFMESGSDDEFSRLIHNGLLKIDVSMSKVANYIFYKSEEQLNEADPFCSIGEKR